MSAAPATPRSTRRRTRATRRAASVVVLACLIGPPAQAGSIADWFAAMKAPAPDKLKAEADTRTNGRLLNRWLTRDKSPFTTESMDSTSGLIGEKGWERSRVVADPVTEAEFAAAKKLFDAGRFDTAETRFAALAKREVKKGTPWGAKAQFYLAECQFRREELVAANDNFQLLIKKYPNEVEFRDKVIAREYEIAQTWLADDHPGGKPLPFKAHFDGRAPLLDSHGYAIKTLEHVRFHDPSGPLADHAALRTGDHYHASGNYEEAAILYDQLLNDHGKSPLRQRAQLSSIDARIKGYIGPEYDGSGLDSARDTIKRTLAEFPEDQANNEQLYHTLDLINDQEANKAYEAGQYYVRARQPAAAEYQFGLVVAKWPKSKWAELARVQLTKTAKMPRKAVVPSKIMTQPGAADPNSMGSGGGSGSGMGGMGSGMSAPF